MALPIAQAAKNVPTILAPIPARRATRRLDTDLLADDGSVL
jgi:hypothetical protein